MGTKKEPYSLEACKTYCNTGQVYPAMRHKVDTEGKSMRQGAREVQEETGGVVSVDRAMGVYRRNSKAVSNDTVKQKSVKTMPPKPDIVALMLTDEDHTEIDRMASSDPAGYAGYETRFLVSVKRLYAQRTMGGVFSAFADATGKGISDYKGWWPQFKALCDFGESCLPAKNEDEMNLVFDTLDVINAMRKAKEIALIRAGYELYPGAGT